MITIKDLAARLGVANSTVGRALADHPGISDETKSKVRALARELGYVTHASAQIMRGRPSTLIGLIIPDIENDFYATMAKSLAEECNQEGFQLVLSVTEDNPDTEAQHIRALVSARAAGVVIVPTSTTLPETAAMLKMLPVVQMIRRSTAIESDSLIIEETRGMHEATTHLLKLGHTRIAYIGASEELSTGKARLQGFRQALEDRGAGKVQPAVWTGPPRASDARQAFQDLVDKHRPSAVIAGGARLTIGVLEAVTERDLSVPSDISIIGFGDSAWYKWWGSGLTTIGLPIKDIASAAGSQLLRRIKDKQKSVDVRTLFMSVHHPNLIVRGSTRAPSEKR
jgi:DNA-binding LacI/PurR family transcriptional regulator